jgi:glycosyltransferase involved in cell wall biosynthesis
MKPATAQAATAARRISGTTGLFAAGLLTVGPHHSVSRPVSKPKMKLLVLAQIPPPLHGQSLMVRTLVEGLPAHGIALHHVNLGLSRDAADIGRWRLGKVGAVLDACLHAVIARFQHGCDTLYYVPAPGKRGALWRDWVVMLLCRPFFKRLVLHWHAAGLDAWLATCATSMELGLTRLLLGRADLSIVLSETLQADAAALAPRKIAVVPNGISDPGEPNSTRGSAGDGPFQVLFLGLGSEEKGLFAAAEAVLAANRSVHAPKAEPEFTLVAAGPFPDCNTATRFHALCAEYPALHHAGLVHNREKARLFQTSHAFCLPTRHEPEGQPLVLLEAMAHDLPIVATRWRAIPDTAPPEAVLVEPGDAEALSAALVQLRKSPPPASVFRRHYLSRYTTGQHLASLAAALSDIDQHLAN